jgi:hypothetical protein
MHGTFFQSIPEASPTLWPDRPMKYIAIQERRNSNSAAGRPAQPAKLHLSPKSCTPSQPSKQTARLTRLLLCSHLCRLPKSTPRPLHPVLLRRFQIRVGRGRGRGRRLRTGSSPDPPPRLQPPGRTTMEAMEELSELSGSMRQAASLLADDDPSDDSASRRPTTFLNAVALGNVVSIWRCRRPLAICCCCCSSPSLCIPI